MGLNENREEICDMVVEYGQRSAKLCLLPISGPTYRLYIRKSESSRLHIRPSQIQTEAVYTDPASVSFVARILYRAPAMQVKALSS